MKRTAICAQMTRPPATWKIAAPSSWSCSALNQSNTLGEFSYTSKIGNGDQVMKNAIGSGTTDTMMRYTTSGGPCSRALSGRGAWTGSQINTPAAIHTRSIAKDPIWLVTRSSTTTGAVTAMRSPSATGKVSFGLVTTR